MIPLANVTNNDFHIPQAWTKIKIDKSHYHLLDDIADWCKSNIGFGKKIVYTYFSPGDLYSVTGNNALEPFWILESDFSFAMISFREKQYATLFILKWM